MEMRYGVYYVRGVMRLVFWGVLFERKTELNCFGRFEYSKEIYEVQQLEESLGDDLSRGVDGFGSLTSLYVELAKTRRPTLIPFIQTIHINSQ